MRGKRLAKVVCHVTLLWAGLLLATACIPRGVRVPQSPMLGALERKSGLIVYVGVDGNIYTVNQGGGNQTAITDDANIPGQDDDNDSETIQLYQFPAWAPDGKQVAFVGVSRSAEGPGEASIYTAAADGSDLTQVYSSSTQSPFYLYWSPDNRQIGFLSSSPSGNMLLQTVPAQGGEAQVLDAGEPFYWSWAPTGQRLLVHASDASAGDRLSFLHLGERVIEEGLVVQPTAFHAPAWSPDGQRVLLAAETEEGENALIVTDSQGTEPQELDQLPDGSVAFGWSPDSKKVAYIASASAQTQSVLGPMTVINLEQPDEPITTEEELVLAFFWAPNNRQIAYFAPLAVPAEEGQAEGEGEGQVFLLGLYILDVENGESERIAVFRPTQEFVSVLPFFDQYHQSITIWSPDSNNLVVTAFAGSEIPSVWVVAASGQLDPRPLTEGVLAFWSWK